MKENSMRSGFALTTLGALGALVLATQASAHADLVSSVPAANAAGPAPSEIRLQFSGRVEPRFSGLDLVKADGSEVPVVPVPPGQDGRTIGARVEAPLEPGVYKVQWRIVAADGHRMTDDYAFTVR